MSNMRLIENAKIVVGAVPIDTTGAAVTGDYVSLKGYAHLTIVIMQGAWAGGTPAVTLKQATDVAATGEKALSFTKYYSGTALTDDQYAANTVSVGHLQPGGHREQGQHHRGGRLLARRGRRVRLRPRGHRHPGQ
jgi:hypothetical protein